MLSQNRHKRSVAKSVSLLVASTLIVASGAQAAETAHTPFVLTAYSNGIGGKSLLSGNYAAALVEIQNFHAQQMVAVSAKANNLCVAYTALKQLTEAKSACTAALRSAREDKLSSSRFSPGSSEENAYIAIAYTNRALALITFRWAEEAEHAARHAPLSWYYSFSSSSIVRGQSLFSRRESARSASNLPPVWQRGQ